LNENPPTVSKRMKYGYVRYTIYKPSKICTVYSTVSFIPIYTRWYKKHPKMEDNCYSKRYPIFYNTV